MSDIIEHINVNGTTYDLVAGGGGEGTVTSVGLSAGTGISISGSPVTSSGVITVSHSNSVTSQTTQGVYPITIDAQGHIASYGSIQTIPTNVSDLNNDLSFTSNTGTVESVDLSNASNGGLSITGSPITTTGTISIGHTNVLTSSQTTQALYPITIDLNGHIASFGSAVIVPSYAAGTGLSLNGSTFNHSNSITSQTTQGLYPITIDSQGHIASYGSVATIPTNVSDLTNDAGYISGISATDVTTALGYTPYNDSNPSGFTSNVGTVTSVGITGGAGLSVSGSPVTSSGSITVKTKLKSETLLTNSASAATEVADRVYPVALDKDGYLAVNVPWTGGGGSSNIVAGTNISIEQDSEGNDVISTSATQVRIIRYEEDSEG